MIPKKLIEQGFSKAADDYDKYTFLQKKVGAELIRLLDEDRKEYNLILDIGTGTGYLLRQLSLRYPCALLFGLDISFQMLLKAKAARIKGHLMQADAEELTFKKGRFDLAVSNLVYQWLSDLDKAFIQVWQVLDKRGKFYFTFFGRDTLSELKECLKAVKSEGSFKNLPSEELVYRKLNASGFKGIEIVSLREEELFSDFFSLLKWLKLSGVNRAGVRFRGLEAKGVLNKMDKIYAHNFRHNGKVFASFEKVIVKAEK
ncbi:MAG: methyltransferase domain-containing protein [Candidatus Omnitrophota bacterium]